MRIPAAPWNRWKAEIPNRVESDKALRHGAAGWQQSLPVHIGA